MAELLWRGKGLPPPPADAPLLPVASFPRRPRGWVNRLILGDRAQVLPALLGSLAGKVKLIYVDPPFNTEALFDSKATVQTDGGPRRFKQQAYADRWGDDIDGYLQWLHHTVVLLRGLLHPRGSLFVHLDWRAAHYARLILDEALPPGAFRAEIVWRYRRWPTRTANLQRMHDTLLYYAADPAQPPTFHTLYEPLAPSTLKAFGSKQQRADFSSGHRKPGRTDQASPGAPLSDVWDIGILAPSSRERLGYPTQKPEALLDRVIQIASDEGDLVLDCCCGSGTTLASAERLGRRWVGCDVGPGAVHTSMRRLLSLPSPRPFQVESAGPPPAPAGQLTARVEREGRSARVTLRGYTAPSGDRGLPWLGAWAVDWDHDGQVFRAHEWHGRPGRGAALVTTATHGYRSAGPRVIALRAFDLLGNEARWQQAVER